MARKYENTTIRQRQIADAAAKIIVKYGSEHLTIKKIAMEVGISETDIYRHFTSKIELLSFLINDVERTLLSEIESNAKDESYTLEILENTIRSHIAQVVKRKGVSFQIIAEIISLSQKQLDRQTYDVINKYIGRIKDILEEGGKAGIIRQDVDLDAAATLFFSMTQGLVNAWALSEYSFNLEEKFYSTWKIFREAIIKK
jgi:AcrR family transcriptional regulator